MDGTDFKAFKSELLGKSKVRQQYDALRLKYELIETIIARRNELALSQRKLARLVGMQQPAIARLERGDSNITVETLFKVADALNLDIECKPKRLVKA